MHCILRFEITLLNIMFLIPEPNLPVIKLDGLHEGRDNLWGKTKQAFKYVHEHYRQFINILKVTVLMAVEMIICFLQRPSRLVYESR